MHFHILCSLISEQISDSVRNEVLKFLKIQKMFKMMYYKSGSAFQNSCFYYSSFLKCVRNFFLIAQSAASICTFMHISFHAFFLPQN